MENKLVFVVDDEPPIAETSALILRSRGYVAFAFLSPVDALEAVKEIGAPDLLITDFKMPEMDGLTLATMMTGISPYCKVLILTGAPQLMESHPERDSFPCLIKPLPVPVLLEAITEVLGTGTGTAAVA